MKNKAKQKKMKTKLVLLLMGCLLVIGCSDVSSLKDSSEPVPETQGLSTEYLEWDDEDIVFSDGISVSAVKSKNVSGRIAEKRFLVNVFLSSKGVEFSLYNNEDSSVNYVSGNVKTGEKVVRLSLKRRIKGEKKWEKIKRVTRFDLNGEERKAYSYLGITHVLDDTVAPNMEYEYKIGIKIRNFDASASSKFTDKLYWQKPQFTEVFVTGNIFKKTLTFEPRVIQYKTIFVEKNDETDNHANYFKRELVDYKGKRNVIKEVRIMESKIEGGTRLDKNVYYYSLESKNMYYYDDEVGNWTLGLSVKDSSTIFSTNAEQDRDGTRKPAELRYEYMDKYRVNGVDYPNVIKLSFEEGTIFYLNKYFEILKFDSPDERMERANSKQNVFDTFFETLSDECKDKLDNDEFCLK